MVAKTCLKIGLAAVLAMSLTGCSYVFDTFSVMRDGQLHFDVEKGQKEPGFIFRDEIRCVESIIVEEKDRDPVTVKMPDGGTRVEYPAKVMWKYENFGEDCSLAFPIRYGVVSDGSESTAKPLEEGVVYQVSFVTSGSGYGGHTFEMKSMIGPVDIAER